MNKEIKQYEVWIAGLNPQIRTEPGKTKPVLIIQSDLLNKIPHPSSIICPITSQINKKSDILRIHLNKGDANLNKDSDVMIDQIRAIDNKRLVKRIGTLSEKLTEKVKENIKIVLDLDYY